MPDTHKQQRIFWDKEHSKPTIVENMHNSNPSGGVIRFYNWLKAKGISPQTGIEMGCGKGRNTLWLAAQGIKMCGFDFSSIAIKEAQKRRAKINMEESQCLFFNHDAAKTWSLPDHSFDIGIDCFTSTDIEDPIGRAFARNEFQRILEPDGYLFVYAISSESLFHKDMLKNHPAKERHTYTHPNSKIDKIYNEQELREFYADFTIEVLEKVSGTGTFYGKEYTCENFWLVLRPKKPTVHTAIYKQ